jgi:hypothetical protein
MKAVFTRIKFNLWTVPLGLLAVTILAYGLLIPFLGYYFDDWPVIWMTKSGADFWAFYTYDRPFSAWTYVLTTPLLGLHPWLWHLFTLVLRWLTSWAVWWVLIQLWPQRKQQVTWIALIFAIYPVYRQLPIAVAYSQHWLTFLLFMISVGGMLAYLRRGKSAWWWVLVTLIAQGLHLFTMEYFWGLELMRPFLIASVVGEKTKDRRQMVATTLKAWLPYALLFGLAIAWRAFVYNPPGGDPNELRWLQDLRSAPFSAMLVMANRALGDLLHILIASWYPTLQVSVLDLTSMFLNFTWLVGGVSGILVFVYLLTVRGNGDPPEVESKLWIQPALIGLGLLVCGPLPVWITGKQVTIGLYSDRFAMASMLGASILVVVLISILIAKRRLQIVVIAVLVGLAVSGHIRETNDFRWDWEFQRRFFEQLSWRVPAMLPGTAIFSEGALSGYMGDYPTAFAVNTFYMPADHGYQVDYWFFELDAKFARYSENYLKGQKIKDSLRNVNFQGYSKEAIVVAYQPEIDRCLWILTEEHVDLPNLPPLSRAAIPLTDLSRILPAETDNKSDTMMRIFGEADTDTWCYFFQKAELARQFSNWQQVLTLKDEADHAGLTPGDVTEWSPFIDANLHLKNWAVAEELTLAAFEVDPAGSFPLCHLWDQAQGRQSQSGTLIPTIEIINQTLGCEISVK